MLMFGRASIWLRGRWPALSLVCLGACVARARLPTSRPPVEPEATPTKLAAVASDSGSHDRVDLGKMEDDRDFLQLSQNVREAARICRGAWQAIGEPGCRSDRIVEAMGNLRRAANLLEEQQSTQARLTASQMAELIDDGAACMEAEKKALEIARLVDILAADFAQARIAELEILSKPPGAEVSIVTVYGSAPPRALRTNGSFVNIPRGRWLYHVEGGDMKPAGGVLDLIDDPRPNLTCILENNTSQMDSSCRRGE